MPEISTIAGEKATWGRIGLVAAAILLARIAYLIWCCPYELAADEAQYWDWSRRLDWSYYSKGPAVAWLIAPSVHLFGITEWAVRLPAALAAFASMLILARFAVSASGGNLRAGWIAMLLFTLLPVFLGTAQFMTIDGPYYACWLLAAFTGWIMARENRQSPGWFLLLGCLIGIGMLCKYTILLLLPGLIVYFIWNGQLPKGERTIRLLALLAGLILCSLPIYIWNHQHGWPTIAHLIGAMRLPGGDVAPDSNWRYNPLWTISYPLYAFALLGPPAALILIKTLRESRRDTAAIPHLREISSFALHTATPVLFFYLLVSFRTDIKLNWPTAGFTVLLVPMACFLANRIPADQGIRSLWHWTVGVGLICAVAIPFAPYPLKALNKHQTPGHWLNTQRALKRINGFREGTRNVERAAHDLATGTGKEPFYVASTYGRAALLAFYLPNHPSVCSADSYQGGRESSYDYFPDTDLANPALLGRPAVLYDNEKWVWEKSLYFKDVERTPYKGRIYRAYEYRGPCHEPHMK